MKGYKYIVLTIVALAILFFSITGSGNKMPESSNTYREDTKRIVLLAHVYNNDYWNIVKKGAEAAAKERGCILEYDGPETSSLQESLRLIEKSIVAKKDGIITYVLEEQPTIPLINKAISKGIPVITVDTDAKKSSRVAYVGTDNKKAGEEAAEVLIGKLGKNDEVGIIMGGSNNTNQLERVEGFKSYLQKHSNIEIVDIKSSNSYALEAELAAKKILKEAPYVDAIFCTSALDGMGAARAVADIKMQGKVHVVSFDDLPETLEYINQGVIYATVAQKPYDMGYKAVNLMMDIIEGKNIEKGEYITDTEVITKALLDAQKKGERLK